MTHPLTVGEPLGLPREAVEAAARAYDNVYEAQITIGSSHFTDNKEKAIEAALTAALPFLAPQPSASDEERAADCIVHSSFSQRNFRFEEGETKERILALVSAVRAEATLAGAAAEDAQIAALQGERDSLRALLNSPVNDDWLAGVRIEAAHQVVRYPAGHDASKTALDWFWLIGYLAQKAAFAAIAGDAEKAKHHTISTGAALLNWHAHIKGKAPEAARAALEMSGGVL